MVTSLIFQGQSGLYVECEYRKLATDPPHHYLRNLCICMTREETYEDTITRTYSTDLQTFILSSLSSICSKSAQKTKMSCIVPLSG